MPDIMNYNNGPRNGKRLTERECGEVYNALSDRINALQDSIAAPGIPERVRDSLKESLALCEKLIEVFEEVFE